MLNVIGPFAHAPSNIECIVKPGFLILKGGHLLGTTFGAQRSEDLVRSRLIYSMSLATQLFACLGSDQPAHVGIRRDFSTPSSHAG
eukprot:2012352-Pyramimonas_sp.AAC.1